MNTTHTTGFCKACGQDTADMSSEKFDIHAAALTAQKTDEFDILVAHAKTAEITKAAEDSVSVYLNEFGPTVTWNDSWFTEAFEVDSANKDWQWADYRDAAKAALKRSQSADLARDPREDESQWRSVTE